MGQIDNQKTLTDGFRKAERIIRSHLQKQLTEQTKYLLRLTAINKGFRGFTGNTQLSYMGGVYSRGKNEGANSKVNIIKQENWGDGLHSFHNSRGQLSTKIPKGEWAWLADPYEGEPRSVLGKVYTTRKTGPEQSREFLNRYQTKYGHMGAVITTGTEYSQYLEEEAHLDVLSKTYEDAKRILPQLFEPLSNR